MIETRLIPRGALQVTSIGFGASGIAGLYRAVPDAQAHDTLQCAWDSGIRYFDTAPLYGHGLSERRLGDFLRRFPRDSYTLSTKVGRLLVPEQGTLPDHGFAQPLPFRPVFDYSYDGVMRSFEHSLQRLGLSRIDMLYVHDIGRQTHGTDHAHHREQLLAGGWRALQSLRTSGAVKAIGLAGVRRGTPTTARGSVSVTTAARTGRPLAGPHPTNAAGAKREVPMKHDFARIEHPARHLIDRNAT